MEALVNRNRGTANAVSGILLILLGSSLLLDRLDVVSFRWSAVIWILLMTLGGYLAFDGYTRNRRGRIFWGTALSFFSLFIVLTKFGVIEREHFFLFPAVMISLGLSFLALSVHRPNEFVLLLPAILFVGFGVFTILLWWDFLDWYDVRRGIRTYWPAGLIVWGVALLARKKAG